MYIQTLFAWVVGCVGLLLITRKSCASVEPFTSARNATTTTLAPTGSFMVAQDDGTISLESRAAHDQQLADIRSALAALDAKVDNSLSAREQLVLKALRHLMHHSAYYKGYGMDIDHGWTHKGLDMPNVLIKGEHCEVQGNTPMVCNQGNCTAWPHATCPAA